ncbi:MAG TPA: prolyl oligopeptidase family serine peptidase [Nannocystaceae bacterium]|nr:prolyl oligopeptidase family serine peptidase [Nannocystaceae bacterium]
MDRSLRVLSLSLLALSCRAPMSGDDAEVPGEQGNAMQASNNDGATPPETRSDDVVDTIHGKKVADPYRWLEDVKDPEVASWMAAQDRHARKQLGELPLRADLEQRLAELSYIDSVSPPAHRGSRYFYSRSHKDKEKAVYYVKKGEDGAEQVLIDPNTLSDDGSISVHGIMPSYSGKLLAYKLSRNNADASTMYLRNLDTGEESKIDTIEGARYAYASWTPDDRGFYYTWLPTDPKIPVADLPGYAEVRYHAIGTDPTNDPVVFPAAHDPTRFVNVGVSRDGRWLLVSHSRGWGRSDVYFADLLPGTKVVTKKGKAGLALPRPKSPVPVKFETLVKDQDAHYSVQAWRGKLYVHTNEGAPRYRVMVVDPQQPAREKWKEIVPQTDAVLEGVQVVGERLVLTYLRDAHSELEVRELDGKLVRKVELPGLGSASGMQGEPDEDEAYYYFSSFTVTPQIYKTSIASGATSLWEKIELPVDTSMFVTEQVWYPSKDGTRIPMFVVRRKDTELRGDNPTILYGYGGFNVSLEPDFNANVVAWVERGGIWAEANLRGGGEFGEDWHRAGMLAKKQNVFDDFAAAAEWLIGNDYTRPQKLAIYGGSNGGLLVGATMTQRPELFGAVVCAVPLLDMVRYHLYGTGKTWISEYGSADDKGQFETLFAYSPYHHVEKGKKYPALLMLSADSDDRVDPMHARKFVAAMQSASTSGEPVLLRIETNAGHGGADMIKKNIERSVDTYAFLMHELGMPG